MNADPHQWDIDPEPMRAELACADCGTRACDYHHTLRAEDAARIAERRAS